MFESERARVGENEREGKIGRANATRLIAMGGELEPPMRPGRAALIALTHSRLYLRPNRMRLCDSVGARVVRVVVGAN